MVIRMMDLYATGAHTLSTLRDMLHTDLGEGDEQAEETFIYF